MPHHQGDNMIAKAEATPSVGQGLVTVPVIRGIGTVGPLLEVIEGKGWIAGGYARWCCSPEPDHEQGRHAPVSPPGDLDVFFSDEPAFWETTRTLMDMGALPTRQASYLVQLTLTGVFPGLGLPEVQLVRPVVDGERHWGPTKEDVVRQIDLSVCRIALDGKGTSTATADAHFLEDEGNRRIRFERINDPPAVLRHAFKYAARGYRVTDTDTIALLESWARIEPPTREARVANGCRGYS